MVQSKLALALLTSAPTISKLRPMVGSKEGRVEPLQLLLQGPSWCQARLTLVDAKCTLVLQSTARSA